MRSALLVASLAVLPAAAAPVRLPSGPVSGVHFDGLGPRRPWVELPGTSFVRVGESVVDLRAHGAPSLLRALSQPDERPVIGIFEPGSARVLNAFALGEFGVRGHSDALPQGTPARELGGYTLFLSDDGRPVFAGSGGVPAPITPAVRRSVLRFVGVRPAGETPVQRLRRRWLAVLDWARRLAFQ
jgi:hypothetical protein